MVFYFAYYSINIIETPLSVEGKSQIFPNIANQTLERLFSYKQKQRYLIFVYIKVFIVLGKCFASSSVVQDQYLESNRLATD